MVKLSSFTTLLVSSPSVILISMKYIEVTILSGIEGLTSLAPFQITL